MPTVAKKSGFCSTDYAKDLQNFSLKTSRWQKTGFSGTSIIWAGYGHYLGETVPIGPLTDLVKFAGS
jgi:hypothetical protein